MKFCTKCNTNKGLGEFYNDKNKKDGKYFCCKNCCKFKSKKYNIENKEKHHKKYILKKEEFKLKNSLYRENNKEKLKEYNREYSKNNKNSIRDNKLKYKYGIDINIYNSILEKQNNACAICKTSKENLRKTIAVDHCHISNKIRGLLCQDCNLGLGFFKDNLEVLKEAINYLKITKE